MGPGVKRLLKHTVSAFVICASLGLSTPSFANPLANELQYLMENYPAIRAKSSLSDAAREDYNAASALSSPTLNLSGDTGFQRTDQPVVNQGRVQGNVTATYNLFDGYYSVFETKSAHITHQSTQADLETTKQQILFQGVQAYLNLILQNKMIEIAKANVKLVEQIKAFIEDEKKVGRMSQADLLQARARLAQANEALAAYQGALRQGQNRYFHLFQRVPTADKMQDPLAPKEVVPESLEEAIRLARKHNPSLKSASLLAEAAAERIGSTESALYPRIDLEAAGDAKYNVDGVDGNENEATVLLKLNWNLFDGERTKSQTRAAALRHNAAMMDLRYKHLEIEEMVRNAFSRIETENKRFRTLQEAEAIAGEAFAARYDMMQSGKETIITVLDSAVELLGVRIAVTSADYGYRLANYQLLLATGQLNQDSISQLVIEGKLQPAVADSNNILQQLLDDKKPMPARDLMDTDPMAPKSILKSEDLPYHQEAAVPMSASDGYNDMAAFEAAHGAPFSPELAPETEPTGPIELGESTMDAHMGSGYYLVLGSFSEPAYAQDRIALVGMDNAFLKPVDVHGTTYQRVLVGPMSQDEAETSKMIAQDRGIRDSWILREN